MGKEWPKGEQKQSDIDNPAFEAFRQWAAENAEKVKDAKDAVERITELDQALSMEDKAGEASARGALINIFLKWKDEVHEKGGEYNEGE